MRFNELIDIFIINYLQTDFKRFSSICICYMRLNNSLMGIWDSKFANFYKESMPGGLAKPWHTFLCKKLTSLGSFIFLILPRILAILIITNFGVTNKALKFTFQEKCAAVKKVACCCCFAVRRRRKRPPHSV